MLPIYHTRTQFVEIFKREFVSCQVNLVTGDYTNCFDLKTKCYAVFCCPRKEQGTMLTNCTYFNFFSMLRTEHITAIALSMKDWIILNIPCTIMFCSSCVLYSKMLSIFYQIKCRNGLLVILVHLEHEIFIW